MSTHPACQIGRVRLKNGGADVRVIHREPHRNAVMNHMSEWFAGVAECEKPPNAYAAVAFWVDEATPGRPGYRATQCTEHNAIPQALLVQMAGAYLVMEYGAFVGSDRALTAMGAPPQDWSPEDAS